jgi:two-component system NtrC family sensor kinase
MPEPELERIKQELQRVTGELQQTREQLRSRDALISDLQSRMHDRKQQLIYTQKMASLGALIAGITHEIRTPIAAIASMQDTLNRAVEKLKRSLEESTSSECLNDRAIQAALKAIDDANRVIESGSDRTLGIVKRMRKFARRDEASLQETDLHAELDDTLLLIHHELKNRIEVVREYGQIPHVTCNTGQINQVFLNVLVNAAQAIEDRGTITVRTRQRQELVQVEIEDTGPGIPAEVKERIFQMGFTTKRTHGTGLGLAICNKIVQEHGGSLELESEEGRGTRVTISLPPGGPDQD